MATTTWQTLLAEGNANEALLSYQLNNTPDETTRYTLSNLSSMQDDLRQKAPERALELIKHLKDPANLLDWPELLKQLTELNAATDDLKRHEPEQALDKLTNIDFPLLIAEVCTLRGTAYIFQNEAELAKDSFNQALVKDPKHFRAMTNLGNLALEAGEVDEAIAAYEKALKINHDFANAYHNLGVAYRRKGQLSKSVKALRKAQSVSQKQLREEARASFKGGSPQLRKLFRWLVYGAGAALLYYILRARGFF